MIIFSHRGLGFEKEENSLESYKEALINGFSIEIDVQKTRDNFLVISHDTNLKRQKGVDKNLVDMDFKEIYNLGIPSFEEVLECFKKNKKEGQIIAVHVKDELQGSIVRLILNKINEMDLNGSCFVFDLTTTAANHSKQINPLVNVGFSVGEKRYTGTIYLWENIKENLEFDVIWWDEWNGGLYNIENFKELKKSNKAVYVISPELHKIHNHPQGGKLEEVKKVWKKLIGFGVDGICTDYPQELRKFIQETSGPYS